MVSSNYSLKIAVKITIKYIIYVRKLRKVKKIQQLTILTFFTLYPRCTIKFKGGLIMFEHVLIFFFFNFK